MSKTNTLGRRKTAIARIYVEPGNGAITVNGKTYTEYFPTLILQKLVLKPLEITATVGTYDIKVNVSGGGVTGQADAVKLAIARALDKINPEFHTALKAQALFTRDPRMVERKKFGQRKARRRFQFSKR